MEAFLFSTRDDEVGGFKSAIRASDIRAADLQAKPTKRVETELILRQGVSSDTPKTAA